MHTEDTKLAQEETNDNVKFDMDNVNHIDNILHSVEMNMRIMIAVMMTMVMLVRQFPSRDLHQKANQMPKQDYKEQVHQKQIRVPKS